MKAIERAHIQLELQLNRIENLELLKKFGSQAWKMHNEDTLTAKSLAAAQLAAVKRETEAVNRKRKADQTAVAPTLKSLEAEFYDLSAKNMEIEAACVLMESSNTKMRDAAIKRY